MHSIKTGGTETNNSPKPTLTKKTTTKKTTSKKTTHQIMICEIPKTLEQLISLSKNSIVMTISDRMYQKLTYKFNPLSHDDGHSRHADAFEDDDPDELYGYDIKSYTYEGNIKPNDGTYCIIDFDQFKEYDLDEKHLITLQSVKTLIPFTWLGNLYFDVGTRPKIKELVPYIIYVGEILNQKIGANVFVHKTSGDIDGIMIDNGFLQKGRDIQKTNFTQK